MICGIDEAGRGCVGGGSLFVCGVAYEESIIKELSSLQITDSKSSPPQSSTIPSSPNSMD